MLHHNATNQRIAAFISIPKNASHSVIDILELGANRDEDDTASLIVHENHQRGVVLQQRYPLDELFTFCFSRNPYDRCLSWFAFHKAIEPYRSTTFSEWLNRGMPHHWIQQNKTDYLADKLSPLLQYTFVEQQTVDFIGRVECFSSDMKKIVARLNQLCKEQGLERRFKHSISRQNMTKGRPAWKHFYTDSNSRMLYHLLRRDFEFFGYDRLTR